MSCEAFREAASARLDGERPGIPSVVLDEHLAGCPGCSMWLDAATRAGRLLRVSGVTPPDLSEPILREAGLPAARLLRRRRGLQAALIALAGLQWAVSVPGMWGESVGMAAMHMGTHQAHESAAWNVAVGAALLAVALRPARAAGTVPILLAFVAVLSMLSVPDLLDGAVTAARLASHAGVALGLLLVIALARAERVPGPRRPAVPAGGQSPVRSLPRRNRGAA
ncbi:zf-HC2 domain-containing protein [Jatrophihabitans sp.]|uniref:zf-HC2 domain-containing protein n=1 Tax=Jatrophihabitans sp. TaxID=1932789 RepID=UPI002B62E02A|nr:zf-HC2 domain-containing protein [Jatrophihabitans sp.]